MDEMLALRTELESRSSQVLQLAAVDDQAAGSSSGRCSCRAGSPATRTGASVWPLHTVVVGGMARIARIADASTAPVTCRAHKR
jgi:hypothetical protein